MFHSDELKYLRADVRVNCEKFLALCKEAGLNVRVTQTVRDDAYQRYLVSRVMPLRKLLVQHSIL